MTGLEQWCVAHGLTAPWVVVVVSALPIVELRGAIPLGILGFDLAPQTTFGLALLGNLTIHGVQKPVVFDLEMHGVGQDPWGNKRSGFTATTTINRKDFGLSWNKALETGQVLVGEEVQIALEVEGIAQ